MGKISETIEQIEDELDEANKEVIRLNEENNKLREDWLEAKAILEEYSAMEDYLEEYHPGIITAFEVAQRMEK